MELVCDGAVAAGGRLTGGRLTGGRPTTADEAWAEARAVGLLLRCAAVWSRLRLRRLFSGLDPRGPSGDGLRSSLALSGKTGASSGSLSTWKDSSELSSTSVVLCLGRDLRLLLAEVLAAPMSFVLSSALLRSSFTVSMLQASDSRQKQTSDVAQKEFEKGETEVSTEQSKQKFQPKWLQNNGSQEKNKVGDADTCRSGQTATPLVESAQLSQKKASRTSGLH